MRENEGPNQGISRNPARERGISGGWGVGELVLPRDFVQARRNGGWTVCDFREMGEEVIGMGKLQCKSCEGGDRSEKGERKFVKR